MPGREESTPPGLMQNRARNWESSLGVKSRRRLVYKTSSVLRIDWDSGAFSPNMWCIRTAGAERGGADSFRRSDTKILDCLAWNGRRRGIKRVLYALPAAGEPLESGEGALRDMDLGPQLVHLGQFNSFARSDKCTACPFDASDSRGSSKASQFSYCSFGAHSKAPRLFSIRVATAQGLGNACCGYVVNELAAQGITYYVEQDIGEDNCQPLEGQGW
ncbi:hypothetical protein K438DRAFT_1773390 [Mycena galopus ATCC 62051]|nr:hypothetical protein K438DRAFT_1773390 [Mycena galopus ATCC 62051]